MVIWASLCLWQASGFLVWIIVAAISTGKISTTQGIEFLNPNWIYKNYLLNYFGLAIVTLFYNLICPVMSICYWFYKLCTVGRK